jgi:Flp pilus assembly protein TadG
MGHFSIRAVVGSLFASAVRRLKANRAAVAMIFALSAPMLVAITGLGIDVGYWYQDQITLQSAVDAAALTAATVNSKSGYNVSTEAGATPYAVTAANNASNSRFNLTSTSLSVHLTTPTAASGTTINQWTASATIPRVSFLSGVSGLGVVGLVAGKQGASAAADFKTVTSSTGGSCLTSLGSASQSIIGNVDANGNAAVNANGCNITADSDSQSAIKTVGNAQIETTNTSGHSIFTPGCFSGNVSGAGGTASNNYNVVCGAPVEADPLSYMGDAPTFWYDTYLSSIPACVQTTSGHGNSAIVLISPPNGTNGQPLTYCLYNANVEGNLPSQGTVYFCQTSSCETDTGSALANYGTNSDGKSVSYFFNNGFSINGGTAVNFGPGIYYFDGSASLSLKGGGNISTVGTGSTFVLEGTTSYSLGGNSTALNMNAPANTADCVNAAYYNVAADSQNNYTNSLYSITTIENGLGICGILIYEARNDTTGGTINGGAASTVNGIIYTPKASFSSTGNGNVGPTSGGTLGVLSDNFNISGNGTLTVSIGSGSGDLAASLIKTVTTTTSSVLLVQ